MGNPIGHCFSLSGNPTLIDLLTRTKQELISIYTPRRKTYSNLT